MRIVSQIANQLVVKGPEGTPPFVPTAGRLLTNLCTLPAIPFATAFAGVGAIAALCCGKEMSKGARAGSLIGGVLGSIVTVLPILAIGTTMAFFSIRGVRKNPESQPEKPEDFQELLNKTWRNACTILDCCFPKSSEIPEAKKADYLSELTIGPATTDQPQSTLPEGKTTPLAGGAIKYDRDSWQCRDPDKVGFSRDHATLVESQYLGQDCKVIITMDGEGHCEKREDIHQAAEETFQNAARTAAQEMQNTSTYESPLSALRKFRDTFVSKASSSASGPNPHYSGKPMMAMVLGSKALFIRDQYQTADGAFIILNKEGTAARFISSEDVPCEVDLQEGDRVIAFTDGVLDGLGDAVLKSLAEKAMARLPESAQKKFSEFSDEIKEETLIQARNSLGKGVQIMLQNLFSLHATTTEKDKEILEQTIANNLENSPYLKELQPFLEKYAEENRGKLIFNDVKRFNLDDSPYVNLSVEEIDQRIAKVSEDLETLNQKLSSHEEEILSLQEKKNDLTSKLEKLIEDEKKEGADVTAINHQRASYEQEKLSLQDLEQTNSKRNNAKQQLDCLQFVKGLLEADKNKVLQPSAAELSSIPEVAMQQLIAIQLERKFMSQDGLFHPKEEEMSTSNYLTKKNAAYKDFTSEQKKASNDFMDRVLIEMLTGEEWLTELEAQLDRAMDKDRRPTSEDIYFSSDRAVLYDQGYAVRKPQVEAALVRHALKSALAGVEPGVEDAMQKLNGYALEASVNSARRASHLDDSTLVGVSV